MGHALNIHGQLAEWHVLLELSLFGMSKRSDTGGGNSWERG